MKPEKTAMTPGSSGIYPSAMKMKKRYPKRDRASDKTSLKGFDRPSYRAREQIEGDEERLAMRLTCLHLCLHELTIREIEKIEQYKMFKGTRTRCIVQPTKTPMQELGLTIVEASSHSP